MHFTAPAETAVATPRGIDGYPPNEVVLESPAGARQFARLLALSSAMLQFAMMSGLGRFKMSGVDITSSADALAPSTGSRLSRDS